MFKHYKTAFEHEPPTHAFTVDSHLSYNTCAGVAMTWKHCSNTEPPERSIHVSSESLQTYAHDSKTCFKQSIVTNVWRSIRAIDMQPISSLHSFICNVACLHQSHWGTCHLHTSCARKMNIQLVFFKQQSLSFIPYAIEVQRYDMVEMWSGLVWFRLSCHWVLHIEQYGDGLKKSSLFKIIPFGISKYIYLLVIMRTHNIFCNNYTNAT